MSLPLFPALKVHRVVMVVVLACTAGFAGIVGVFQGRIVDPKGAKREEGVLYIRARNGMARKVKVEKAAVVVEYDEDVPKSQRRKQPVESLCEETLVRVTAEQTEQEDGAWRAINILILPEPQKEPGATVRQVRAGFLAQSTEKPSSSAKEPENRGKKESGKTGMNGFCVL